MRRSKRWTSGCATTSGGPQRWPSSGPMARCRGSRARVARTTRTAPGCRCGARAASCCSDRLSERLPSDNPTDELGRLASVFNDTLGRLESSFEQMRRFTADVSHELRTPLMAIKSVGEVGLRERRDEASYRGIIGSMLEEA